MGATTSQELLTECFNHSIMREIQVSKEGIEITIKVPDNYDSDHLMEIQEKVNTGLEELLNYKENEKAIIWKNSEHIGGYWINIYSDLRGVDINGKSIPDSNRSIFIDEAHAKSALAMAQISQLMPYYGGTFTKYDWENPEIRKYTIVNNKGHLYCSINHHIYHLVAFHTVEQREAFMSRPENIQLLKDYYMVVD